MKPESVVRRLERLLEDERRLLVGGQLDQLAPLVARKERLLAALEGTVLSQSEGARLRALSERNQLLLDAARSGLAAARETLQRVVRGVPVNTYSRSGERSEISEPVRTLHRRA